VQRTLRFAVLAAVVLLAAPAASVTAASRMPIGFFDDPSFRWSRTVASNLLAAQNAHASIIHVTVDWSQVAPKRPKNPLNGNDPAYRISDIDALVRDAGRYGLEVMINITGAPKWTNGGQTPNHPPRNVNDLKKFAQMLAVRYNGKTKRGLVSRWSFWNEPNLQLFLTPQFVGKKIVSPQTYLRLYKAAYAGIKAGNRNALVAVGETSNQGRDHPSSGSGSVAPATFARLLAQLDPNLRFDAWATHPYPTRPNLPPTQKVRYPNVTLTRIDQFGQDLQKWFHHRVPIWVTEYAEQTKPEYPPGVSYSQQAADAKTALRMAAASPFVEMFVWFTIRDSAATWQSGLIRANGKKKPSYSAFANSAKVFSGQSQIVRPGRSPVIKVYVPFIAYHDTPGTIVGVTYRVFNSGKLVAVGQPRARLSFSDRSVSFVAKFTPQAGKDYTVTTDVNDPNGWHEKHTIALTTPPAS
jgi:Cellulase (glycosyl hydrolase family 5)